ncbi:unnamed protein product [Tenebrio molitor]|nr:unnamed protein product [Tenebrio molitor]
MSQSRVIFFGLHCIVAHQCIKIGSCNFFDLLGSKLILSEESRRPKNDEVTRREL